MCRRTEEEVEPFVGFFNVPVQARTSFHDYSLLINDTSPIHSTSLEMLIPSEVECMELGFSEKPPHFSRLLRRAWEYGGPILVLHPRAPRD